MDCRSRTTYTHTRDIYHELCQIHALQVAHNFSYNVAGIAMWTAFENVFAFLWATGRLAYMSDAEAFSSRAGMLRFIAGLVLVPIWREVSCCYYIFNADLCW